MDTTAYIRFNTERRFAEPTDYVELTLVHERGDGATTEYPVHLGVAWSFDFDAYDHLASGFEDPDPNGSCFYRLVDAAKMEYLAPYLRCDMVVEITRTPRGSDHRVSVGKLNGAWACRNEDTGALATFATKARRDLAARDPQVWA